MLWVSMAFVNAIEKFAMSAIFVQASMMICAYGAEVKPANPSHSVKPVKPTNSAKTAARAEKSTKAELKVKEDKVQDEKPSADSLVSNQQIVAAINDLKARHLLIPIDGIQPERLKGSFAEMRDDTRHEAVDILSPRNTPVRAVEDGKIAKLFLSKFGGNTIYQIDPTGQYVYYYAHLEGYEPNLKDGASVKRGDIIGFVGTSGNAPPDTPHLHFAVSVLTPEKQYWRTRALDPYLIFQTK